MIEQNSSHTEELNLFHDELTPQNGICQRIVTKDSYKQQRRGTSEVYLKVKDHWSIVRFSTPFLNAPLSKEMGPGDNPF